jgi:hypothetical protein
LTLKASLIAAVLVIAAGAAVGVVIGGKTETKVVTRTQIVRVPAGSSATPSGTTTPTAPATPAEKTPRGKSVDSLTDFENAELLVSDVYPESLNVAGKDYSEALTDTVYDDGSGFSEFKLITKQRYASLNGIAGINAESECPQNGASVSIRDQANRVVWGPKTVTIDKPVKIQDVPVADALQLRFVNRVARGASDSGGNCSDAHADPAWANIELTRK